ncbi:MAG TPA: hypothetical protein VJR89_31370 [Polyangiales bacterium]|nr:hypothetical protein [Polyangiales bacterium]
MHKPLTLELTQPLSQPLAMEASEEVEAERAWEASVRLASLDAQPLTADVRCELPLPPGV